jgi:GMP reductase
MSKVESDTKLDFSSVLIKPRYSTIKSRKDVDLNVNYTFKHSRQTWSGVPILAANMDGVGTVDMALALQQFGFLTCLTKTTKLVPDNLNVQNYAVSTGINEKDLIRLQTFLHFYPETKFICIDVANGYSQHFLDFITQVREQYPDKTIIAGNVVTPDMALKVVHAGADIVKIGIGSGAVCTTRIQTGVGFPQLSAILECSNAVHQAGAHIISDGGCTCPGDVAKAFGAGADFVMLGSMLAGHDEGGGIQFTRWKETGYVTDEADPILSGECRVQFYGMSSDTAMKKHHGEVADYRSSEGRTVEVPYRGAVETTVKDLLGGIRSSCSYVGATELLHMEHKTTFIKVTQQFNDALVK